MKNDPHPIVVQLHTRLGPWPHLLNTSARIPGLSLESPYLSLGQMHALRNRTHSESVVSR